MGHLNSVCTPCSADNHIECNKQAWDYDKHDITECRCWRAQHSARTMKEIT